MNRVPKLFLAYILIFVLSFGLYKMLWWLTEQIYADSWIGVGDKKIVENGKVYEFLYWDNLIWLTLLLLVLATIWILKREDKNDFSTRLNYFLTSKKINMMVGALFIFNGLGIALSKGKHDVVAGAFGIGNLISLTMIFIRFISREIYLRLGRT